MDDALHISSLPDDPQLLKAILIERSQLLGLRENRLAALERTNAALERTNAELELEQLRLKQQLMLALKKLYGPRGDRLADEGDVAQLLLEFAATLEARPVDAADLPPGADAIDPQCAPARSVLGIGGRIRYG